MKLPLALIVWFKTKVPLILWNKEILFNPVLLVALHWKVTFADWNESFAGLIRDTPSRPLTWTLKFVLSVEFILLSVSFAINVTLYKPATFGIAKETLNLFPVAELKVIC